MKPLDMLFWLRAGLGALSGYVAGLVGFVGDSPQAATGIVVAVLFYIVSHYVGKYVLEVQVPSSQSRVLFTTGLGSFVMLFLFTWILYNTFSTAGFLLS